MAILNTWGSFTNVQEDESPNRRNRKAELSISQNMNLYNEMTKHEKTSASIK